ncbi:MAG: type II 3-dehydroquinate dehydratase [Clostridia bacterium]
MKMLVLNGPNLNLLGIREPALYGAKSYQALEDEIRQAAREAGVQVEIFQSNHEGALVDKLQAALGQFDGVIINPAAYTHTSVALLDALKAIALPAIEVHLTQVDAREDFRKVSFVRAACLATIVGHGFAGYTEAIKRLKAHIEAQKPSP